MIKLLRRPHSVILTVGVVLATFAAALGADPPAPPKNNVCGVNCLYMFLRTLGREVPQEDLIRNTPCGDIGTSLLELQQTARRFGIEAAVYECELEDVGKGVSLPAIAFLKPQNTGLPNHYCLVYAVEPGPDGRVLWIDGTLGYDWKKSKAEFQEIWAGYVLAPRKTPEVSATLIALTIGQVVLWTIVISVRVRRPAAPEVVKGESCVA